MFFVILLVSVKFFQNDYRHSPFIFVIWALLIIFCVTCLRWVILCVDKTQQYGHSCWDGGCNNNENPVIKIHETSYHLKVECHIQCIVLGNCRRSTGPWTCSSMHQALVKVSCLSLVPVWTAEKLGKYMFYVRWHTTSTSMTMST